MDSHQARSISERFIDQIRRLEDGDKAVADRLADMFADNAELTNPIIENNGGSRRGRDRIAAFCRHNADSFGELHSEFFEVTTSDHSAGLFWRSTGADPSGQALQFEGVSLLVFDEEGKIASFQGFFDSRRLVAKQARTDTRAPHPSNGGGSWSLLVTVKRPKSPRPNAQFYRLGRAIYQGRRFRQEVSALLISSDGMNPGAPLQLQSRANIRAVESLARPV